MNNQILSIEISDLHAHPDNPNRMSKANFRKLVRHIETTGRYEPIIVRPKTDHSALNTGHQIINGHHRVEALKQLGYTHCDCVVWDVDDDEAAMLLVTLNRLSGRDVLEKKLELINKLNQKYKVKELAKLLPNTGPQIKRLIELHNDRVKLKAVDVDCNAIPTPMVFFLNTEQKAAIEQALSLIETTAKTKADRNAEALTSIAKLSLRGA